MSTKDKPDALPVAAASPDDARPAAAPVQDRVDVGSVWREKYRVVAACDASERRWFASTRVGDDTPFLLRVSGAATEVARQRVWSVLTALDSPGLHRPIEAHTSAERVEVWGNLEGVSLRTWRAGRNVPGVDEIRSFVHQMADALERMHGRSLGHFAVKPSSIFVRSGASGTEYCLGGFDCAARSDGSELVPIPVDLMYAPPEAAGLAQHPPGPMLLEWDWWSLGRVVQEFVLGQHVLMLIPEPMYTSPPRGRLQMIEDLLFERDVGALRAGAVTLMQDVEPSVLLLLQGLLTTAVEGRWGSLEVREWLDGGSPRARYEAPRQQRFFRLEGRGYTPAEAAQILRGPSYFREMVEHVFGATEPGRFAHFLQIAGNKHHYGDMLEQATNLTNAAGLKPFPPELVREIAAAIALTAISGGRLFWNGRPLVQALEEMLLQSEGIDQTRTLLRALAVPATNNLMNLHDSATAARLEVVVAAANDAERLIAQCGLAEEAKGRDLSDLWRLALEGLERLEAGLKQMRKDYACTDNAPLEAIFQGAHPSRGVLVLLAWTSRDPKRFKFKTHEELKAEKLAALAERGRLAAQALFWLRMERAMGSGPLLFGGRWPVLAASLAVVLLLAVHVPGPAGVALGLIPFVILALVRIGVNRWLAHLVKAWTDASPWTWFDGLPRTRAEARAVAEKQSIARNVKAARAHLKGINAEITALAAPAPARLIAAPPRHWAAWIATCISWTAVLLIAAGSLLQGIRHPPTWVAHTAAWHDAFRRKVEEKAAQKPDPAELGISWPFKLQLDSPFPPVKVRSLGSFTPTEAQAKAALQRAREIVAPYRRDTIDSLTAVYVPLDGNRAGLMLFDGKSGNFKSAGGILIDFLPMARTWLLIDGQAAIFVER